MDLFDGIKEDDRSEMLKCLNAKKKQYKKGSTVLGRGGRTSEMGMVLEGSVHMVKDDFW